MKHKLPSILFLFTISFLSCDSPGDVEQPQEEKKYNVVSTVTSFSSSVEEMPKLSSTLDAPGKVSAIGDTLRNYADNLYYRVYNASGKLVSSASQVSTATDFGTITDHLPYGTYEILFAASKGSLTFDALNLQSSLWGIGANPFWNDTFSKRMQLVVGTTDIEQSVRLDRTVGAVEVNVQDAIPVDATNISIEFQNEFNSLLVKTGASTNSNVSLKKEFTLVAGDVGVKNKKFLMHVANTFTPSTVIIKAYNGTTLVAEKKVLNVTCVKNKRTVLSGYLFTGTSSEITVDPIWQPSSAPIPF